MGSSPADAAVGPRVDLLLSAVAAWLAAASPAQAGQEAPGGLSSDPFPAGFEMEFRRNLAAGQESPLGKRIAREESRRVRFSFRARPGVCGCGDRYRVKGAGGTTTTFHRGHREVEMGRNGWACEEGRVRVTLERDRQGRVREVWTRVAENDVAVAADRPWREADVVDLGRIAAPLAADYFLGLVEDAPPAVARNAITPAVLADSATTWPRLLAVAKDEGRPATVRKRALFWVGQAAAGSVTGELRRFSEDERKALEIRKHAVFALSRRPADQAVPALIGLVRENGNPELRRAALFWLGQLDDHRVPALFEEILTGGGS